MKALGLAPWALAICCSHSLWGAAPGGSTEKPYTILYVQHYDLSEHVEVVKVSELGMRVQEIEADFRVWKEADRLARAQWTEWFRASNPYERSNRRWVVPSPTRPSYQVHGRYADEFDAEAKVNEFKARIKRNFEQRKSRTDLSGMIYLDNLKENEKLLRSLLPQARQNLQERDNYGAKRLSDVKKQEIWNTVHYAEIEARKRIAAQTDEGEDLDILDIYNLQQELLKPIYARFKIDEGEWFVIWEEGDRLQWAKPDAPKIVKGTAKPDPKTATAATLRNVKLHLRTIRAEPGSPDAKLSTRMLKDMGNPALPIVMRVADEDLDGLKQTAVATLAALTGQDFGANLNDWHGWFREFNAPPPAEKPAVEVAAEGGAVGNNVADLVDNKPPQPKRSKSAFSLEDEE